MAKKPQLLIQGSSWTVGAYKPSATPHSDDLVPGGLDELLSETHHVTNISVQDDFNLGCTLRLREHLDNHGPYDQLLVCQNDPLRDLVVLRSTDHAWRKFFHITVDQLLMNHINTVSKLCDHLLNQFYHELSQLQIPTVVFAGPSQVNVKMAQSHGLIAVPGSWTQSLVPEFSGSITETSAELDYACQLLQRLFPENSLQIKQDMCDYSDSIGDMLNTWREHPELFARHHPTPLGNEIFYQYIRNYL